MDISEELEKFSGMTAVSIYRGALIMLALRIIENRLDVSNIKDANAENEASSFVCFASNFIFASSFEPIAKIRDRASNLTIDIGQWFQ